ncbi:biotin synthase BioB [Desulfovibrio aerotolerans]|uniref:Biotin synthase n=1 Tax=Solidesulfovibrio aerotolerans TaxID=295255 RepID=A0A7C9J9I0_9BACT|nr:biotin synthase BioB [Solidesulfovibrio aerotolerans]MYL83538.1 biotin synthase BioB [Solidesulfovibrio aerotolerans]
MPLFSTFADALVRPLLAGGFLAAGERDRLLDELPRIAGADLDALGRAAAAVRLARVGDAVSLCAIISAKSGRCGENCAFCAQSGHFQTTSPQHAFLAPTRIAQAAAVMQAAGVARFGLVASGKALPEAELAQAATALAAIAATGMAADASLGVLPRDALARLKAAGLAAYHHNLETSRAHYPNICTTRTFEDNLEVLRTCRSLGIPTCSGGLFGLGESWADRADLALTLLDAAVFSVPVNFLSPIPGTPLAEQPVLSRDDARRIVILLRLLLPDRHIRICGGRPTVFGPTTANLAPLACGADGLMVGDYLTTGGASLEQDKAGLQQLGFVGV